MKFLNKLNNLKYGMAAGLTLALANVNFSFANGIGDVTDDISQSIQTVPRLFTSAAYIMGVGFTIAGLFKLKEYVDDPTSGNMKNALIRLALGALLILIPFVITTTTDTLGGSQQTVTFDADAMNIN